jgi:hypothetical protein
MEVLLVKQLKIYKRNTQELTNSIKRPNLRIMGIEEGEEVQPKFIHNIFNKIITEIFQNLEKVRPILVQEASWTPSRLEQNRTSPGHTTLKTSSTENKERILKSVTEKKQIKYKGKPMKIIADFSIETLKERRAWNEVFWALH